MKVLLTHRYFAPDSSPYGVLLRQIGDALADAGHDVHVLSTVPSYRADTDTAAAPRRQRLAAMNVTRIWVFKHEKRSALRRVANVALYCRALIVTILRQRPDVVTASTFPPVVAAWSASLAAKWTGAKFIYHVQDIHPEVSIYSGGRLGRGLPMRLLRWLDNQTLKRSSAVVVLSEDMADTLNERELGALPISILNNPPLKSDEPAAAPPDDLEKTEGTVRAIFAGNLGHFQNLSLLAEGVALCFDEHPELELMFLGDGAALPELKARWGDHPQVRFAPFMPFAQARGIISGSDIGLVALSPNLYRVAYPSKIATYLDLGLRLLALVEPESQLARELERYGTGAVPHAATPPAIAAALEALLAQPNTAVSASPNQPDWAAIIAKLDEPKSQDKTDRCF